MSAELEQSPNDAVVLCRQAAAGAGSSSAAAGGEAVPPLAQARRAAVTLLRLQGQLLLEAKRMDEVRAGSRRVKGLRVSAVRFRGWVSGCMLGRCFVVQGQGRPVAATNWRQLCVRLCSRHRSDSLLPCNCLDG